MKAKNWKKFVPKKDKDTPDFDGLSELQEKGGVISDSGIEEEPFLQNVISENSTLKKLFEEREKLEKKMGQFTGGSSVDDRMVFGEIPSITEKQKQQQIWETQRRKYLEQVKQQRSGAGTLRTGLSENSEPLPALRTNTTPSDLGDEGNPEGFIGKVGKKKDDFNDEFEKRRHKIDSARKSVDDVKDRFASGLSSLDEQLNQFKEAGGEFEGSDKFASEVGKLKETLGDDSKLNKKLEKMTDSFIKKRGGEKLDQRWEQLKKKKQELNRFRKKKDSYEERKKRLLNVDRETLEEFDERRRKRREERNQANKEAQKAEERKEERKKMIQEKLLDKLLGEDDPGTSKKSSISENRKEEEQREEERQLQKEQRLAQQRAEKQENEKRENRRAKRRRAKKEEEQREERRNRRRNKSRFE